MMFARGVDTLSQCVGCGGGFMGYGRFGMPMMGLGFVLLVLGVIAAVYFIKKSGQKNSVTSEMELLNTRFIKGEVTEEEYNRMKSVLKSK